jgi:hypothetical protein
VNGKLTFQSAEESVTYPSGSYVHGIMDSEQGMKRNLEEQPELLQMIPLV